MQAHIDYLSFTLPIQEPRRYMADEMPRVISRDMQVYGEYISHWLELDRQQYIPKIGRKPYPYSFRRSDNYCSIFYGLSMNHFLVEVTGQGCQRLHDAGYLHLLLEDIKHRLTRIDVAVDIPCSVEPTHFIAQRADTRFKSNGYMSSNSGVTAYIGSMKSNRFCRVYRYAPPHPRSDFLRAEFVTRRKDAQLVAQTILDTSIENVAAAQGEMFGFRHPVWNPGGLVAASLGTFRADREMSKTVYWMYRVVAPSLKKLVDAGEINLDDLLKHAGLDRPTLPKSE